MEARLHERQEPNVLWNAVKIVQFFNQSQRGRVNPLRNALLGLLAFQQGSGVVSSQGQLDSNRYRLPGRKVWGVGKI